MLIASWDYVGAGPPKQEVQQGPSYMAPNQFQQQAAASSHNIGTPRNQQQSTPMAAPIFGGGMHADAKEEVQPSDEKDFRSCSPDRSRSKTQEEPHAAHSRPKERAAPAPRASSRTESRAGSETSRRSSDLCTFPTWPTTKADADNWGCDQTSFQVDSDGNPKTDKQKKRNGSFRLKSDS